MAIGDEFYPGEIARTNLPMDGHPAGTLVNIGNMRYGDYYTIAGFSQTLIVNASAIDKAVKDENEELFRQLLETL